MALQKVLWKSKICGFQSAISCISLIEKLKFKILYLDFVFYLNMKNSIQIIDYYFSCLLDFYFVLLMPSFIFYFHKKWKAKYSSLFVLWKNWKTNYLKRSRLINFMVTFRSIVYTLFKGRIVSSPLRFSAVIWPHGRQNSMLRKQLMYFNVYITGYNFQICFILIVNCNIKHISRSSHREVYS